MRGSLPASPLGTAQTITAAEEEELLCTVGSWHSHGAGPTQEQGLEFLPMEHRIKRDWKTWREHMKGGKLLGYNAYLEGHRTLSDAEGENFPPHQAPQAYAPMSRDADNFHPSQPATGLFNVDAVQSVTLQRANSVAY